MGAVEIPTLIYWVITAILVAGGAYAAQQMASKSYDDAEYNTGLRINTRDTAEPIKVIYGEARIGINEVYFATQGTQNTILWVVNTLCEGPIEGIAQDEESNDKFYLHDELVKEYAGYIDYWLYNGTSNQNVDPNLNAVSAEWTDCLRYTAYLVTKFTWNIDKFQNLPKRTVVVKGLLLYDPRDGSTVYSNNPALAALDWLTNGRYGMGLDMGRINMDSVKSAANYCDTKGWTINMGISQRDRKNDILDEIFALYRGGMTYDPNGGLYYFKYADLNYESSAFTIEDKHILQDSSGIAGINIAQGSSLQKAVGYNVVFIDPEKEYTTDRVPVGDSLGKVEDLKLLGCNDRQHAADLGIYYLERQLLDRIINISTRDDCIELEPHDVVTLNSSSLNLSNQLMRVVDSEIRQSGQVQLSLQYESTLLYDDDYNLEVDNIYNVDIPSPLDDPPSVTNVSITEVVYQYRLRSESRFDIVFTPPDYIWFSHVEVWQSFDNVNWVFLFEVVDDFQVGPLEEGQTYYFRLKVVSIRGKKQSDANDYKISSLATGKSSSLPPSLTTLYAIVTRNNGITLYSQKIWSEDIEVYEFRLGTSWSGAVFLASLRSPNLVYNMVKPGLHTFFCNTLGTNGLYGASPVSAQVTLPDPPDDYTIQQTKLFNNLVVNGDMELASNWTNVGTPTAGRSSEKKHADNYSWKIVVDAAGEGIKSDTFTTVNGRKYGCGLFVYPDTCTSIRIRIRNGLNSAWIYDQTHTGLTQDSWNEIIFNFTEGGVGGGSGGYIEITSPTGETADTWYIDDVVILEGDFTDNMAPVLYNGDAYIKCRHISNDLDGIWYSPIIDLGSSGKYLVYATTDIVVTGQGTTWNSQLPSPNKWSTVNINRKWREIFELSAAPAVEMDLKYGVASPPINNQSKLEILAVIVTGRYYQLKLTITDPQNQVFAYVEGPNLKFTQ